MKEDSNYPEEMRAITGMPSKIFYKGAIEIINQKKNIAVIGSRKCSERGRELSYYTGRIVGMKGINLVNGLALGCDTETLRGALSVGGMHCCNALWSGTDSAEIKSEAGRANIGKWWMYDKRIPCRNSNTKIQVCGKRSSSKWNQSGSFDCGSRTKQWDYAHSGFCEKTI